MPKFSISVPTSLDDTLKEMGVTDAFGDKADFSGMSSEVMLKLSRVWQKWQIMVYQDFILLDKILFTMSCYLFVFFPLGFPPGCAECGWNWNRGSGGHHYGNHANEHAGDSDAQQALHRPYLGALNKERPLYGQDKQPHCRVKVSSRWPVSMCP